MDGVSWSTPRSQESFSRSASAANTLSKLASFLARADPKQQRQQPPAQLYFCQECGKGFSHAAGLLQHQESKHTLPKPHRCPSCGQEFSLKSSLQLHQCDRSSTCCEHCSASPRLGSLGHACTTWTLNMSRLQDKSLHRQPDLLDSTPYACAPCGRGFSQKQALLHHQQAGCSEPPSPSSMVDASSLPEDSPPASEGGSTRSNYSDTPGPSSRDVITCSFCSRTFRSEAAMERHKENNHADQEQRRLRNRAAKDSKGVSVSRESQLRPKNKLLSCRSCDMVFRSTSKLYVHRKEKHSREKPLPNEQSLDIHKRGKAETHACQICNKVFIYTVSLRAHYRQHAAKRGPAPALIRATKELSPLEDKPNTIKPSLVDHRAVRGGEGRPREEPTVTLSDELQVRVSAEEEEGEFPCPSCPEVFSLQWQLKEHVKLHQSSVRRRQCSVCTNNMDTCKGPGSKRHRLYHCVPCQQGFSALDCFLQHCQEHLRVRVEEDRVSEALAQQASKA
ncbi:Zinc finger protein 808 [Oryzias melastigma]|uniref:Zinc finger protein 808 n=1 Tax=Oryzias melastigma TaxID=30732 RepID=A0A834F534_ORYME|nr:Zinc finger protein 808 [Oryzias melastigma]